MGERVDLDLVELSRELRRRAWLVVTIAILAAGVAVGLSQLQNDRYAATADLLFKSDPNAYAPERAAATNLALASNDAVVVRVQRRTGLVGVSLDDLRERFELQPRGQADLLEVEASGSTAADAARLANAYADAVVTVRRENAQAQVSRTIGSLDARLANTDPATELAADLARRRKGLLVDKALAGGDAEVIDRASPPLERAAPRPVRNGIIGGVLGFVLAIMLVLLLRAFDRRMSDEEAVDLFGAPILARIPVAGGSAWRKQLFGDAFQFLRANVIALLSDQADSLGPRALREKARGPAIVVTSPMPTNGKSTTVARLGEALAASGARVLAIDADLRKPTLGRELGAKEGEPGLADALLGSLDPYTLVQPTAAAGLSVLSGGLASVGLGMPIASPRRLLHVVDLLRIRADVVLVDTAPVTIAAETSIVAAKAQGVIVVLDARDLDRATLTATRDQLQRAGAQVIGLVINFAESQNERVLKGAYGAPYRVAARMPSAAGRSGGDEPDALAENPRRSTTQLS